MTIEEKQLEFMIYCIESTAERLGRYGSDVYNNCLLYTSDAADEL